jgi:hypothetical protein
MNIPFAHRPPTTEVTDAPRAVVRAANTVLRRVLGLGAMVCCLSSSSASAADGLSNTILLTESSGASVLAVYDDLAGVITLAKGLHTSNPEWKYVPVRRYGVVDGNRIRAADLNGDGLDDLILPAYTANRLLVIWGADLDATEIPADELAPGPGPAFAAPARLDRSAAHQILIANTARAQIEVRGWDMVRKEPVTAAAAYPAGFALAGLLGFETAASSREAADPVLGMLRLDAGGGLAPVLELFDRNPNPEYGPNNSIRSWIARSPHQQLISGFPNGADQPGWFLAYSAGSAFLEFFPSGPGDSELFELGQPVARVSMIPDVSDEVLVLFSDGAMARFHFSPATGLVLNQQFDPPAGLGFSAASGANGTIIALLSDAAGQLTQFNVFNQGPAGYELANQGAWPPLPALEGAVTVVLYTADPFSSPPPFPFETFLAGDWATGVFFGGGMVNANSETFGGISQGLQNPTLQTFPAAADPGPAAVAIGNQWEPSSSLFQLVDASMADGVAAVTIQPPPGSYPTTIGVGFQAGENVTVFYRINQNPWQTGFGPVWIHQNSVIQYYGEHAGGALSSIQIANYHINQSLAIDTDGDGIPDLIEAKLGSNPLNPDSHGTGAGDLNHLLYGDPNDPNAPPSELALPFDEFPLTVTWDDDASAALPSASQRLFIGNLSNHSLGDALPSTQPGTRTYGDITLKRGNIHGGITKKWLPSNFRIDVGGLDRSIGPAMTAFGAIPTASAPVIPLDLTALDPVAAWPQAALEAVEAHANTIFESSIGPSSTVAALVFEYWFGLRLAELGRIPDINQRPLLADPPNSIRAGIATPADVEAFETPHGNDLLAHELAHVVQQLNDAVLTSNQSQALREVAESFYAQAIDAANAGTPIDPPIHALRRALDGFTPPGYTLPHPPATLVELRDELLADITPRNVILLTGILSIIGHDLVLNANGDRYLLCDRDGRPYRLDGAGLIVNGTLASVTGVPIPSNDVAIEEIVIAVERIELASIPAALDTDLNGNGLPDSWELAFLGSLDFGFWDDLNGNGFSLAEEYAARVDPTDPFASPPGAPAIPQYFALTFDPAGNPVVEWDGSFFAAYELIGSQDLFNWEPQQGLIQRSGDRRHSVAIDLDQSQAFFQLRIQLTLP